MKNKDARSLFRGALLAMIIGCSLGGASFILGACLDDSDAGIAFAVIGVLLILFSLFWSAILRSQAVVVLRLEEISSKLSPDAGDIDKTLHYLDKWLKEGLITQEEFELKRAALIGRIESK